MPGVKKNEEAHVTHRVRVEIQAASRAVGLEAQEAFSECIREEFPQLLERWFEARFPPGTRWRKERLELNLGRVSARICRACWRRHSIRSRGASLTKRVDRVEEHCLRNVLASSVSVQSTRKDCIHWRESQ